MNSENFSPELKRVVDFIKSVLLVQFPTYKITLYHFLFAMIETPDSFLTRVLSNIVTDFTLDKIKNNLQSKVEESALVISNPKKKQEFDKEVEDILKTALTESKNFNDNGINSIHVCLSILKSDFEIKNMLTSVGINYDLIKSNTDNTVINEKTNTPQKPPKQEMVLVTPGGVLVPVQKQPYSKKNKTQNIEQYTTNLSVLYQQSKIDKIIGREKEVVQLIRALLKRNKNNVILTGENGCGITSIVNLLVQRIFTGDVPVQLLNKEILQININTILNGTAYKGMFEQRTSDLIKELKNIPNKYILFIDDINISISSDNNNEIVSFINTLLKDDDFKLIATCPLSSYKISIERFPYIEKNFNKIVVESPTIEETIKILQENKHYYEKYHNIVINDNILENCTKLCDRYITNKKLPSSVIEVIDILGSNTQSERNNDLKELTTSINELMKQQESYKQQEKYQDSYECGVQITKLQQEIKNVQKNNVCEIIEITNDDVLNIVSELSKIPITNISIDELKNIKELPTTIKKEIVHQDDAVDGVCKSIQKRRVNIRNSKKPNVFLFVGSSGCGKTYLAELLAKHVFGDEKNIIKLNGSEYSEEYSASRILGSPVGYIGYGKDTILSEIKNKPFSIVLLDEFEKMHDKVINIFLQVFDKGNLVESDGTTLDFSNTIIILTSNLGSRNSDSYHKLGFGNHNVDTINKEKHDIIEKEIKKKLSPEIRNRIDEIIYFNHLRDEDIRNIIQLQLNLLANDIKISKYKCDVSWNDDVVDWLLQQFTEEDKKLGARAAKRIISSNIEDNIVGFVLENGFKNDIFIKIENKSIILK